MHLLGFIIVYEVMILLIQILNPLIWWRNLWLRNYNISITGTSPHNMIPYVRYMMFRVTTRITQYNWNQFRELIHLLRCFSYPTMWGPWGISTSFVNWNHRNHTSTIFLVQKLYNLYRVIQLILWRNFHS